MESKSRGVLDPRFRGDDGFLWSGAVHHTPSHRRPGLTRASINFARIVSKTSPMIRAYELRRLVLVAMAAAAVRFSTPSLA
jgi:hypothetical protein